MQSYYTNYPSHGPAGIVVLRPWLLGQKMRGIRGILKVELCEEYICGGTFGKQNISMDGSITRWSSSSRLSG